MSWRETATAMGEKMKRRKIKRYFASVLAALTALSMMPTNVLANESSDYYNTVHGKFGASTSVAHAAASKIVFDTGEGPGLNKSTYTGWAGSTVGASGYYEFSGAAGSLLSATAPFNGGNYGSIAFSGGNKPDLPWGGAGGTIPTWNGYSFQGWKRIVVNDATGGNEEAKTSMEPAYPYYSYVIYKALWSGSSTFNLKTTAVRDLGGGNTWKFNEQTTGLQPGNSVERTAIEVPGYKLLSANGVEIGESKTNSADNTPIGDAKILVNAQGNGFTGVMPNRNVDVNFNYEPDTSKTFRVKVEYVADNGGIETPIILSGNNNNVGNFPAESDNGGAGITVPLLANIPSAPDAYGVVQHKYNYLGYEIVTGNNDSGAVTIGSNTYYKVRGLDTTGSPFTSNHASVNATTPFKINKMPNQGVTIKYKYTENAAFPTNVTVKYRSTVGATDPNFPTINDETHTHAAGSTYSDIVLPVVDHYTYSYIDYDTAQFNLFTPVPPSGSTPGSITYDPKEGGDTITVYYSPNLADMATVTLSSTTGGSLGGITTPPQFIAGTHALSDIVASVTTAGTANTGYVEDGWYYANASGNGVSTTNPNKLEMTDMLTLTGGQTTKLIFKYVKDPNAWSTVRFRAGSNGSIAGAPSQTEKLNGTALSSIAPTPTANAGYVFAGWYNLSGNLVGTTSGFSAGDTVQSADTYTAMFMLDPLLNEDHIYAIPHLNPSVDANGNGKIKVENVNTLRDYVVVDENGTVVAAKSGITLQNRAIENLVPGQKYSVYEIAAGQPQSVGSPFVPGANQSQPAVAIVPSVGSGYSVNISGNSATITVNPASSSAVYALVDENGDVVAQAGSADGWVSPSSGSVTFSGLSPEKTYSVVSKPVGGSQTPQANAAAGYGKTISVSSGNTSSTLPLTVKIEGEGRISGHTSGGASVAVNNQQLISDVKAGDQVSISTNSTDAAGNAFVKWQLISGNVNGFNGNNRSQTITVNSNTVLEAVYAEPIPATPSVAVKFAPETGAFGITTESLKQAKNSFNTNATSAGSDFDALSAGKTVEYIIRLDKKSVSANVFGIVESQRGDNTDTLWQLNVGLKRNVNGVNKPVPTENENYGPVQIYTTLAPADMGMIGYALYRVDEASGNASEVPTQPDLNSDGFNGIFSFDANIGESFVLSYSKPVNFKLVDSRTPSNNASIRIRKGSKLVDNTTFTALGLDFTSNLDNGKYAFKGYSRSEGDYQAFDINTESINSDLTLYAFYELAPDWAQSRTDLANAVNTANGMLNNSALKEEHRNLLTSALADAVAVFNKTNPSPTVAEMDAARAALNAVIQEINGYIPQRPQNNGGGRGGSGGSGRGGSGGGSSGGGSSGGGRSSGKGGQTSGNSRIIMSPARAQAYMDNVDGSWKQVGNNWEFNLKNGDKLKGVWADIIYLHNGQTKTETYYFNADGVMHSGWINTESGWYYLSTSHNGSFGSLLKGWINDGTNWYYLDQISGVMRTGWINIGSKYYYLSQDSSNGKPMGAMYANMKTPDGYDVDANGEWIRETP